MRRRFVETIGVCVLGVVAFVPTASHGGADGEPTSRLAGVSPGSAEGFLASASSCPTFTWTQHAGAAAYELRVFRVEDLERGEHEPAVRIALPAGAGGWSLPGDRCLEPGERYAWSVRATGGADERDGDGGAWSDALLFAVPSAPSLVDVEAALRVLEAYRDSGGSTVLDDRSTADAAAERTEEHRTRAAAGTDPREEAAGVVRALSSALTGPYGLRAVTNAPDGAAMLARNDAIGGADVALDGTPSAAVSESSFVREDAGDLTFDFANPGAGSMTLQVDGVEVVTTATDQDTLGGLTCADGEVVLRSEGIWDCGEGGASYAPGNQLELVGGDTFNVLEGTGSGLDADTLDGQSAAAFAATAHSHSGGDITSGTVAEPRIAAAIARDNEILPAVLAQDGTGSTLDADFLDGKTLTELMPATADDWVNETGDTMAGTLVLSPASGGALTVTAGNVALHGSATVTKGPARFLWDDAGNDSFSVGRGALGSNTSGGSNTAVGTGALDANTDGAANTAVGRDALGANVSGTGNVAVGRNALAVATASGNTALGFNALAANTTGDGSVALGRNALNDNTTGNDNTAVGAFALGANATGVGNVAVGRDALAANLASNNTAVGALALDENTSGAANVALGFDALGENTSAFSNTALGTFALQANTIGRRNVAAGTATLQNNTEADYNVAVGVYALYENTLGSQNTAVGYRALLENIAGNSNVAVGKGALESNTDSYNVAIGLAALGANTTGENNVAIGASALAGNEFGDTNVAVGTGAGSGLIGSFNVVLGAVSGTIISGDRNVVIGPSAGTALTTGSDNIVIGNAGVAGESDTIRIGDSDQTATFIAAIFGEEVTAGAAVFVSSDGHLGTMNSSARYKQEIADLGRESERLLALRPVRFRYRAAAEAGVPDVEYGLIAEEVAEVFPELVIWDDEGRPQTVKYHLLSTLLLHELQLERARSTSRDRELGREVEGLRAEVTALRRLLE